MRTGIASTLLLTALAAACTAADAPAPKRTWQLTRDGVLAGTAGTAERRAVPLPGWIYVHESYACPPELALGPKGEAVVTSNVIPTLWRVDPSTLEVSEHPLALDVDDGSELGFTAIAYSTEHAAYFAISGAHGTLWKIDPSLRLAQKIPLSEPVLGACGMTVHSRFAAQKGPRYSRLCAAGPSGRWTIDLAPDQRAGYARAASFQECPVSAGLAFREE